MPSAGLYHRANGGCPPAADAALKASIAEPVLFRTAARENRIMGKRPDRR